MKPLLERYTYDHKGVAIYVEVNYQTKQISLIEKDGTPKKWLFAGRGTSYTQGWQNILEAMQAAMLHANTRLTTIENIDHDTFVDLLVAVQEGLK